MPLRSLLPWSLLALAVVALTLFRFAGTKGVNYDDVFIVLVYAKHLLASGEFYWNLQDGTLDGFTSLLDLLMKTAAAAVHPQDRLAAAWSLTLLISCAIPLMGMVLVASLQEEVSGWRRFLAPALAGLLLSENESLAVAAASLLEGPVFVLLTLIALWLELRRPRASLLLLVPVLCLLPLARPEGLGVALLLALWHAVARSEAGPKRRLYPLAWLLIFLGLFVAWRIHVFGYWAPNTYYAKSSANRWNEISDGVTYVLAYARTRAGMLICATVVGLPLLVLTSEWTSTAARMRFLLLVLLALAMTGAVVVAGGDSYDGSRFMILTAALGIVSLAAAFAGLTGRWRMVPLTMMLALLVVQGRSDLPNWKKKWMLVQQWPVGEARFECDRWLAQMLSPLLEGLTVAQSDYQMFKYFADDVRVIDLHGLNDREIAHRPVSEHVKWGKFRVANGLERRPALWFFGYKIGYPRAVPINEAGMRAALTHPAIYENAFGYTANGAEREVLIESYRPVTLTCGNRVYNFLVEKDQVPSLRAAGLPVGGQ